MPVSRNFRSTGAYSLEHEPGTGFEITGAVMDLAGTSPVLEELAALKGAWAVLESAWQNAAANARAVVADITALRAKAAQFAAAAEAAKLNYATATTNTAETFERAKQLRAQLEDAEARAMDESEKASADAAAQPAGSSARAGFIAQAEAALKLARDAHAANAEMLAAQQATLDQVTRAQFALRTMIAAGDKLALEMERAGEPSFVQRLLAELRAMLGEAAAGLGAVAVIAAVGLAALIFFRTRRR